MGDDTADAFVLRVTPRSDQLHGHIIHDTGEVDVVEEALQVVQCMSLMEQRVEDVAYTSRHILQMSEANMSTLISTKKFISFSREYRMMKS